jgi:threonine dehydratase
MTLSEFRHVRSSIQPHIRTTPVVPAELSNLYLKLENLQHTHSFKVRGAFAHIIELAKRKNNQTVLTVSAGNHGQGIARAASVFNIPCIVVVPANAARIKMEAIRRYGADLRVEGANYDEAEAWTFDLARNTNDYVFVSPYNDRLVILGQGTVGFEILEQLPQVNAIVIPIGGGGLAAGVAAVVKQLRPKVRIIGVQAEASAAIYHSLKAGRMITIADRPSIADGIAGNIDLQTMTFPLIQKHLDDLVLVSEEEIETAIGELLTREKLVAEGSAAAAYAAVTTGKVRSDGPIVAIITGGNIDMSRSHLIEFPSS